MRYSNDKHSQGKELLGNKIGLHPILFTKYASKFIIFVLGVSNGHADKLLGPQFPGRALS